eukprot:6248041-Amphidinium_carterae.1
MCSPVDIVACAQQSKRFLPSKITEGRWRLATIFCCHAQSYRDSRLVFAARSLALASFSCPGRRVVSH